MAGDDPEVAQAPDAEGAEHHEAGVAGEVPQVQAVKGVADRLAGGRHGEDLRVHPPETPAIRPSQIHLVFVFPNTLKKYSEKQER